MLAAAWAAVGIYAFIAQQIPDYLFLRAVFLQAGENQTPLTLFIGYLGMIGLFTAVGHYLAKRGKKDCPKPLVFLIPVVLCALAAIAFCLGGWNGFAKNMRSAYRAALEQDAASFNLGIRLVRNAAPGVGLEAYDFTGKTILPFCSHGAGRGHHQGGQYKQQSV